MAFVGPMISRYGMNTQNLNRTNLPPKIPGFENSLDSIDGIKTIPDGNRSRFV